MAVTKHKIQNIVFGCKIDVFTANIVRNLTVQKTTHYGTGLSRRNIKAFCGSLRTFVGMNPTIQKPITRILKRPSRNNVKALKEFLLLSMMHLKYVTERESDTFLNQMSV
jgi:hypothetical protein